MCVVDRLEGFGKLSERSKVEDSLDNVYLVVLVQSRHAWIDWLLVEGIINFGLRGHEKVAWAVAGWPGNGRHGREVVSATGSL